MVASSLNIEDKARSALLASPVHALHRLDVEHIDDALMISGRVSSFYHKQLAQEAIRSVASHLQVVNEIDVDYTNFD